MGQSALAEPASFADREAFAAHPRTYQHIAPADFQLDPDGQQQLKVEVWATSPLIFSPVAMDVDAQGRVWCTEGIDYNNPRRVKAGQSIVVLTDTDQDGRADQSHVFITEPHIRHAPMGIAVFDNRIVLSATPSIIVYTDINRNAVFDPGLDKREVFLTGFQGGGHDHSLHAVVGGPNGQWYFSYGNMGADVKTRDGRHFLSGSYYGSSGLIGRDSSDGHRYIGGAAMRVNPDGTGLAVVGHNLRNTHDMVVTSFGDVLHNDNDDPAHCRATWLMEYGNLGYADLLDGSKSWEEIAKPWEEDRNAVKSPFGYTSVHGRNVIRSSASHWRESYPGTIPPGDVYGPGSPTGVAFIEGDELGRVFRGKYLACDMVHKALLGYQPKLRDAQIDMGAQQYFLSLKAPAQGKPFLPTDVVVNTDGSVMVSDFYNSTSRRTVQISGTIYRISRKDEKRPSLPKVDFSTANGLAAALRNPAINVRFVAQQKLVELGQAALPAVDAILTNATNPYHRARAIWVAAQLGAGGLTRLRTLLTDEDEQTRLVAFRALRHADPASLLRYAKDRAADPSPAVQREVALSLRDVPFNECHDVLRTLVAKYEGDNRWSLEALGVASSRKETQVYDQLIRPMLPADPATWNRRAKSLAWRLHTPRAAEDLHTILHATKAPLDEFRWLIMGLASFRNEAQRASQEKLVASLANLPFYAEEPYQLTIREVLARDLRRPQAELLRTSYLMPKFEKQLTKLSSAEQIARLDGDPMRGRAKAAGCLLCHKIGGAGHAFGPNLSSWGRTRTPREIIAEILDPDAKLAHGYDKPVRLVAGKHVAEGLMSNYSYHAGSLKLKILGGETKKILFRRSGARIVHLPNHSWMPSAAELGLTDQDVRDIAAYLQSDAASQSGPASEADAPEDLDALFEAAGIAKPTQPNPGQAGAVSLKGHALLGVWRYLETYSREIRPDGQVILRNGDKIIWTKQAIARTPISVTLEGGYTHVLKGDVLHIENRYHAHRAD